MKKPIFYLILFTSLAFAASAKQLSQRQACSKAQQFVRNNSRLKNLSATDLQLAYTQTNDADNTNSLYVFNNANNGFVVVAADDCVDAILGYSDAGAFDPLNIPPGLQTMMNEYSKEIRYATDNNLTPSAE